MSAPRLAKTDDRLIEFLCPLVEAAGRLALREARRLTPERIRRKGAKDLVTAADCRVEEFLICEIRKRYPGDAVLAEESGCQAGGSRRWVIDPIDGTASFIHQQPFFAVSVAVEEHGRVIAGAVRAPRLRETWWAVRGGGAWCGRQRLTVSGQRELSDAMLATGFACLRAGWRRNNLPIFCRVAPRVREIRRFGSAAIDLAYVAAGRLDGFWELNLKPYDVAAGALLVSEAGGRITDLAGGRRWPQRGILATNGLIHHAMLACVKPGR